VQSQEAVAPRVGAEMGGGEFDDAGGDLAVEQNEGSGHPHPQVEVVVGQAPAQRGPAFVVAEEVFGQTVAAEPGHVQVGGEIVLVCPAHEVP